MRVRFNKDAKDIVQSNEHYIENVDKLKGKNINLEIGMGKGDFLIQLAFENKDNVYVGIELNISVLASAVKKINEFEKENNVKLDNLFIMSFNAIELDEVFSLNSISNIYLNFSDPWPKKRHDKRRLTHYSFLNKYDKLLVEQGKIYMKTDNRLLFEFSLESFNNYGLKFEEVYLDLHKTDKYNILTEYERKFCEKGPIYMAIIGKNIDNVLTNNKK